MAGHLWVTIADLRPLWADRRGPSPRASAIRREGQPCGVRRHTQTEGLREGPNNHQYILKNTIPSPTWG